MGIGSTAGKLRLGAGTGDGDTPGGRDASCVAVPVDQVTPGVTFLFWLASARLDKAATTAPSVTRTTPAATSQDSLNLRELRIS